MGNRGKEIKKILCIKAVAVVTACLLMLGGVFLMSRPVFANAADNTKTSAAVTENRIGRAPEGASVSIELYKQKPEANEKFEAVNMLPGDSVSKEYYVRTYHNADVTMYFRVDITKQTKSLGNALFIRMTETDTGNIVCDIPFSEADGQEFSFKLLKNENGETISGYRIEAYLDTSVGNEYQAAELKADFSWFVKGPDTAGLTAPDTGDFTNAALLMVLICASAIAVAVVAIRRKREGRQDD